MNKAYALLPRSVIKKPKKPAHIYRKMKLRGEWRRGWLDIVENGKIVDAKAIKICSVCHKATLDLRNHKFCPSCGTRMIWVGD